MDIRWLAGTVCVLFAQAAAAADISVSFLNSSAVTDSNDAGLIGAANANLDTGNGRVAIESALTGSLSTTSFDNVGETATGEVGLQWAIEADHCLGAGGCGGSDHYVDATGDLTILITVLPKIGSWTLELGVQSFGNINGVVDGGTLPACTSVMSAPDLDVSVTGTATAVVDFRSGANLSLSDSGTCVQQPDWFKDEDAAITVSGTGGGIFEVHVTQDASVTSERQTNLIAIKNGSDTCYRAGRDPGASIAFFDACDYPGLADANGNRDGDGLLGNEPDDGGIWLTDRVTGAAIEVIALQLAPRPVPALGAPGLGVLAVLLAGGGLLGARRSR